MALISPKGYVVVEDVTTSQVVIRWHRDAAHRARYKAGESDIYETTHSEIIALDPGAVFQEEAVEGKTVRENIVTKAYEFIKESGAIAECEDA